MPEPPAKRRLWATIGLLIVGAAALWGSSRLTWWAAAVDAGVRGTLVESELGAERAPALVPLAVLAAAGIAGVIATSGWPRRLLGAVLLVAGAAACVLAVVGAVDGGQLRPGHLLALLGGVLVLTGGAVSAWWASAMPRLGQRYENPQVPKAAADRNDDLWKALSKGEDPTFDG